MHTWKAINVGPGQIYPSAGYLFSSTPTALHDKPIANCEVCGEEKACPVGLHSSEILLGSSKGSLWYQNTAFNLHPTTWARDLVDPSLFSPKDAAVIYYVVLVAVDGEKQKTSWRGGFADEIGV